MQISADTKKANHLSNEKRDRKWSTSKQKTDVFKSFYNKVKRIISDLVPPGTTFWPNKKHELFSCVTREITSRFFFASA